MVHGDTRARTGLTTFLLASSALIWVSAVIVMGILAYLVSRSWGGDHIIFELVIAVLTTAFFPLAFFLVVSPGFILLFNLIFSYLWIVAVSFTASDWSRSQSNLLLTVEAFSFIAFFFLLFNVLYDWHYGFYRPGARTRAVV
ncbi:hypothetical protein C8A01DRAFT_49897 [Parachaetomium inaequale]|uniref:MARVEL domain-containing protein n=1 Tax=Parachaetomium inaequale TaxID=2588326 RepID=A0AAN6P8C1_9PEZI|nr:hypothetical protein C8A01DRAFT_49897 [Parachaetomium inaequale]